MTVVWDHHNEPTSDAENIRGHEASILIDRKDGTSVEKRVVPNTGHANLFFPAHYEGSVTVTVSGSKAGEVTDTITV